MEILQNSIKQDLESLYNLDFISASKELNKNLGLDGLYFSEKKPPMYFNGKFDAETVFVMLNPGSNIGEFCSFAKSLKYRYETFDAFYDQYMFEHQNYGKIDYCRKDNFDLKQAAFLFDFKDSGLNIPDFFSDIQNTKLLLDAKEEVLMNKLQLELIPYCSVNFDKIINNSKGAEKVIDIFTPHILRIFDAITSYKRKFVIFGAQKFTYLFEAYESINRGTIDFGKLRTESIDDLKKQVNWQTVTIKHNSQIIHGLIPHSFPRRDLPNAYKQMRKYGKYCFESMSKDFVV